MVALQGQWAEQNVDKLDGEMLAAYAAVLDQENPDLFKWLTGQLPASEEMQQNKAFLVSILAVLILMPEP